MIRGSPHAGRRWYEALRGLSALTPPSIAAAEYDPATGTYVGPDGHVYTQANLARSATEEQTWQTMLLPPKAGSRASR